MVMVHHPLVRPSKRKSPLGSVDKVDNDVKPEVAMIVAPGTAVPDEFTIVPVTALFAGRRTTLLVLAPSELDNETPMTSGR